MSKLYVKLLSRDWIWCVACELLSLPLLGTQMLIITLRLTKDFIYVTLHKVRVYRLLQSEFREPCQISSHSTCLISRKMVILKLKSSKSDSCEDRMILYMYASKGTSFWRTLDNLSLMYSIHGITFQIFGTDWYLFY